MKPSIEEVLGAMKVGDVITDGPAFDYLHGHGVVVRILVPGDLVWVSEDLGEGFYSPPVFTKYTFHRFVLDDGRIGYRRVS